MTNDKRFEKVLVDKWPIILAVLIFVAFAFAGCQQFLRQAPTAVISATPTSGTPPLDVSFDGTGSSDPDGTIATYGWAFGDGDTATGVTQTHTYTTEGTYTATLTVTDNDGLTDSDSVSIEVSTAPTAEYIYFASNRGDTDWDIYRMNADDGSNPVVVYSSSQDDLFPALRPNNRGKLAFSTYKDGSDYDIWTSETDGTLPGNRTELQTASDEIQPSWSYDGSKIAYASNSQTPSAQWDVFIMDSDGTDIRRLTEPQSNSNYLAPSIKPTDSALKIAFTANCSSASIDTNNRVKCNGISDYEIFVMTLDSGNNVTSLEQLTSNGVDDGVANVGGSLPTDGTLPSNGYATSSWEPDGNKLAYTSDDGTGNLDIKIYDLDDNSITTTAAHYGYDEFDPFWLPDGNTIAYVADSDSDNNYEVFALYLDTASTKQLTDIVSNLAPAKE